MIIVLELLMSSNKARTRLMIIVTVALLLPSFGILFIDYQHVGKIAFLLIVIHTVVLLIIDAKRFPKIGTIIISPQGIEINTKNRIRLFKPEQLSNAELKLSDPEGTTYGRSLIGSSGEANFFWPDRNNKNEKYRFKINPSQQREILKQVKTWQEKGINIQGSKNIWADFRLRTFFLKEK